MNNKEFISRLSSKSGHTQTDTQTLVKNIIETMSQAFENGDIVSLNDLGSFEIKKRLERIVINPTTGNRMLVPPKLVLNFKPCSSVKERLKGGNTNNE